MSPGIKGRLRAPYTRMLEIATRWSRRRVGLALVYHKLGDSQEDREGHLVAALASALFEGQMRHLKAHYRPVAASELIDAVRERRLGERIPVAVTFDDDLPSHVRIAMPILRRLGIPATFFVCGASLDRPHGFWWERLQLAYDRDGPEAVGRLLPSSVHGGGATPTIREAARAIEALPTAEKEEISERLLRQIGADPPDSGLRAADLRALAENGFEIGFHTRSHPMLPNLAGDELDAALTGGRQPIEAIVGGSVRLISYPHGKADRRVADAARNAGYELGFTTEARAFRDGYDPLLIGRPYPSYADTGRFALESARNLRAAARGGLTREARAGGST
jgi:peptidoglycan/xylan/chitin deacetylase (PgdA/CDA1 family)